MSYYIYSHIVYLYLFLIYHSHFQLQGLHQRNRGPMHFIWLQSHRSWMQQLVVFWLVLMEKLPSGEKWYISCHEMEMESWWWVSWVFFCFSVDVFFERLGFLDREIWPFCGLVAILKGKRCHENAWKADQSLYFFLQHRDAILYWPTKTISKVISQPTTSRM